MAAPQTPLTRLKTPLAHPVAQWLVIGGLLLSLFVAWTALRRPHRPWVGASTEVGTQHRARSAPRATVHPVEAP